MIECLFVYGTLGPGRPNEHELSVIGGTWMPATVKGSLLSDGWGAEQGYPGIKLDENGKIVEGYVFTSKSLSRHWAFLDEFEGKGYERVLATATLEDGSQIEVYIYQLSNCYSDRS